MKKYMSIIFDDAPNIYMNEMVDKFVKHGFSCGFAIVGNMINSETLPMVKYAIDNNCQIVSHGQTHANLKKAVSVAEIEQELMLPVNTIEKQLGHRIKMARLPFLSGNEMVYEYAEKMHLPLLGQGIKGGRDWDSKSPIATIAQEVIESACNGAIGCLHVRENTCKALDIILPELKRAGFCLVTPDEIFEAFGVQEIPLGVQINNVLNNSKEI